jgi:hypothetical protein
MTDDQIRRSKYGWMDTNNPERCAESGAEYQGWRAIESMMRAVMDVTEDIGGWRIGDGCGGGLHEMLDRIAAERGLFPLSYKRGRRTERDRIVDRDGWGCHYCGVDLSPAPPSHVEHKVPKVRGGSNALDNKVLSCGPCNQNKGVIPHDEFPHECGDVPF